MSRVALRVVLRNVATPLAVALFAQLGLNVPSQLWYALAFASVVALNARDFYQRRLNPIAAVVLLNIGLSAGLLLLGEERILVRQAVFEATLALAAFGSLVAAPRPLTFYFGRQLFAGGSAASSARYDAAWQFAASRRLHRLVNAVWGLSFSLQTILALGMLAWLQPPLVRAVAPLLLIGIRSSR